MRLKLLTIVLLLYWTSPIFADSILKSIRHNSDSDKTRIVLDSNNKLETNLIHNKKSNVFFLFLNNTKFERTQFQKLTKNPFIKKYYYGGKVGTKKKFIFELNSQVNINDFHLKPEGLNNHRYIIDITKGALSTSILNKTPKESTPGKVLNTSIQNKPKSISSDLQFTPQKRIVPDFGGNISKKYFEKTCIKKTCKSLTKPGAIPTSYKHVTYYAKRFSTPKKKTFIVAIDPGHGGKDPGALGSAGGMEKDIVLAIGRKVAYLVSKHPGMKAVLVRKDDTFIELKERVIKANSMGAKIFVSIHADSTKNKDVFGSSAHVLSNKSKYGDIWKFLAIRNVDYNNLESGLHDSNFLTAYSNSNFDLTEKASQTLASLILKNMEKVNKLLRPEAYKSDFTVLKSWKMPSVLVETDFISNPEREKELLSEHFQNKIARSIFEGIKEYYLFYSVKYL